MQSQSHIKSQNVIQKQQNNLQRFYRENDFKNILSEQEFTELKRMFGDSFNSNSLFEIFEEDQSLKETQIKYYLPAYLRFKFKNITNIELKSLNGQTNGILYFSFFYGKFPDQVVNRITEKVLILFSRDQNSQKVSQDQIKITKNVDKEQRIVSFQIRRNFKLKIEAHVWLSPFQVLNLILTVYIRKLYVTITTDFKEQEVEIFFNFMDRQDVKYKISDSKDSQFGDYIAATGMLDAEYVNQNNHKDLRKMVRDQERGPIKQLFFCCQEQEKVKNSYMRYAHFTIPLYKEPHGPIFSSLFPVWFLGTINLAIFFQENRLADRLGSIATLAIAFVQMIPIIKEEIPPTSTVTYIQSLVYLMVVATIFCFAQSLIDAKVSQDQYEENWQQKPLFLIALIISCLTVVTTITLFLIHEFYWKFKYNKQPCNLKMLNCFQVAKNIEEDYSLNDLKVDEWNRHDSNDKFLKWLVFNWKKINKSNIQPASKLKKNYQETSSLHQSYARDRRQLLFANLNLSTKQFYPFDFDCYNDQDADKINQRIVKKLQIFYENSKYKDIQKYLEVYRKDYGQIQDRYSILYSKNVGFKKVRSSENKSQMVYKLLDKQEFDHEWQINWYNTQIMSEYLKKCYENKMKDIQYGEEQQKLEILSKNLKEFDWFCYQTIKNQIKQIYDKESIQKTVPNDQKKSYQVLIAQYFMDRINKIFDKKFNKIQYRFYGMMKAFRKKQESDLQLDVLFIQNFDNKFANFINEDEFKIIGKDAGKKTGIIVHHNSFKLENVKEQQSLLKLLKKQTIKELDWGKETTIAMGEFESDNYIFICGYVKENIEQKKVIETLNKALKQLRENRFIKFHIIAGIRFETKLEYQHLQGSEFKVYPPEQDCEKIQETLKKTREKILWQIPQKNCEIKQYQYLFSTLHFSNYTVELVNGENILVKEIGKDDYIPSQKHPFSHFIIKGSRVNQVNLIFRNDKKIEIDN